jgi:hypothetical protein
LYEALFEVTSMRNAVGAIRPDLEETETTRFLSRLEVAELSALQLIDRVERDHGISAH